MADTAFERQLAALTREGKSRRSAEQRLVELIGELAGTVTLVEASLQTEETARELLEQLRPDGETRTVELEDSPDWPDVDELITFLAAGPRKPIAAAEASAERTRREAAVRRNEAIVSIIRQYGARSPSYYEHIARFPAEFQEACNAAFARVETAAQRRRASGELIDVDDDGFPVAGAFVRL
jgi:hypothetical protein